MDKTHDLIGLARDATEEVVELSGDLLRSGADIARVQRDYVYTALDQLAEAEAQALLAVSGDRASGEALDGLVAGLKRLLDEVRHEHVRQVKRD